MTKESKILLVVVLLCTVFLAGFQYFMQMRVLGVNLKAAQEINKAVQATPAVLPTVEASASASASATPKGKASPSLKATVKPTVAPVEAPEASPEEGQ